MKLHYRELGKEHSGTPIVVLHGFLGSLDNWISIGKYLQSLEKHVILVDQRNHGASPHSSDFSYEELMKDLNQLVQEADFSTIHLIGHSMGGKTAMKYALEFAEKVEKLVIADIAPKAYEPKFAHIFEALLSIRLENYKTRKAIDEEVSKNLPDFGMRQFLLKNLKRTSEGFVWKANLPLLSEKIHEIGRAIESEKQFLGKALFLHGEKSDYIEPEDNDEILSLFPGARLSQVKQAGHWLHAENPKGFLNHLLSYLDNEKH